MTDSTAVAAATKYIDAAADDLVELSHAVHGFAEIGFEEHRSVARVAELLGRHGIEATIGGWELPTALHARVGQGAPHVAIFAEYDALPGVGHGCGHNVICASAVGAMLGAAAASDQLTGTIELFGTPAEENGSGKELMARAGAFEHLSAAVMLHPTAGTSVASASSIGLRSVEVAYHGQAAHAASAPHRGRNALDAIVLAYQGIAALRQHMLDTDRIHGIIQDGGAAANVVPELSRARFIVRALDLDDLVDLSRRVQRVLEGAALMTETTLDARWDQVLPNLPIRSNEPLSDRFETHLRGRGHVISSRAGARPGSTDLGNVSMRLPAIHPYLSIAPDGVPLHTSDFAAHAVTAVADQALVSGAQALAGALCDYLSDASLQGRVRAAFDAAGGPIDVERLLSTPLATGLA